MAMANCQLCGKLFNRVKDRICPQCERAENEEFQLVVTFMRENHVTFIPEIADATGVDRNTILKWVHEGKLELARGETSVEGRCKRCGKPVYEEDLCKHCRQKIAREIAEQRASMTKSAGPIPAPRTPDDRMHHLS